jgi:integrase
MFQLLADAWPSRRGQTEVTLHILRHTFATRALQQTNIDLATLSRILGHENLTTTARYLHPNRTHVATMIEEL